MLLNDESKLLLLRARGSWDIHVILHRRYVDRCPNITRGKGGCTQDGYTSQSFGIPVGRFNIVCLFPCSVVPAAPGLPLLLFLGLRLFLFDAIAVGLVVA